MKYPLALLGALLMATASTAFAQESNKIVLGFENGLEDFTGDIEQDTTVGKTGSPTVHISAPGGQYTGVSCYVMLNFGDCRRWKATTSARTSLIG